MSLLSRLFTRKAPSAAEVYNSGLQYAMSIAAGVAAPIGQKLASRYPKLSPRELSDYAGVSKKAAEDAHQFTYDLVTGLDARKATIKKSDLKQQLSAFMRGKYPWVSDRSLSQLFNTMQYFLWHDGRDTLIR